MLFYYIPWCHTNYILFVNLQCYVKIVFRSIIYRKIFSTKSCNTTKVFVKITSRVNKKEKKCDNRFSFVHKLEFFKREDNFFHE